MTVYTLLHGDCLAMLPTLDSRSVDAVVTDPPAGIAFMNKHWDKSKGGRDKWIAWMTGVMTECYRIAKPGAYALVWSIPRTSHWTATGIEDAGWQIRDKVYHLFGSGFPKSLNIAKQLEGKDGRLGWESPNAGKYGGAGNGSALPGTQRQPNVDVDIESDVARQWIGYGTALKPAAEEWILAQKPLDGTYAANVARWGCGALNIDGTRIGTGDDRVNGGESGSRPGLYRDGFHQERFMRPAGGRWPANLILDEAAAAELDEISGLSVSRQGNPRQSGQPGNGWGMTNTGAEYSDCGGASRFFYVAKASRSERDQGLEHYSRQNVNDGRQTSIDNPYQRGDTLRANTHPTVKPITLMRYLVRLVTPPDGLVLDPFMGSGSTGVACMDERRRFIGVEREEEYIAIAQSRIEAAAAKPYQPNLFEVYA